MEFSKPIHVLSLISNEFTSSFLWKTIYNYCVTILKHVYEVGQTVPQCISKTRCRNIGMLLFVFLIHFPQRLLLLQSLVLFGNKLADVVFFYIYLLGYGRFRGCVVCRILEECISFGILALWLCVQLDNGSFSRRSRRPSGKNCARTLKAKGIISAFQI